MNGVDCVLTCMEFLYKTQQAHGLHIAHRTGLSWAGLFYIWALEQSKIQLFCLDSEWATPGQAQPILILLEPSSCPILILLVQKFLSFFFSNHRVPPPIKSNLKNISGITIINCYFPPAYCMIKTN